MYTRIVVLLLLLGGIHGLVIPAESYCQVEEVVEDLGDCMTLRTGSMELVENDILILISQSGEKGVLSGEFTVCRGKRAGHDGDLYSADDIYTINLVSLHGEFCRVRSTADILQDIT